MIIRRLLGLVGMLVLAFAPGAGRGADLSDLGVVFIHGKGVWPGMFDGGLPAALEQEGAHTASPEMPWSARRMYGATYQQALAEIDVAVAGLRAQGATRIIVIGHSLGANAAIGYAARYGPLAGVIAIAPGHLPDTGGLRSRTASAVAEAKQLVAAGQGNASRLFPDRVQGVPTWCHATPEVYLSMFDPDGPAVMSRNAAAMPAIPFLWVAGRFDPIFSAGPQYAYAPGAKNPASRYLEVTAGHLSTAIMAHSRILDWIHAL